MSIAFSRPRSEWPLVLCGPMLRRVTAHSITVFVALRDARRVTLRVYDSTDPTAAGALRAEATADTIPLGAHLHVLTITAKPGAPLTTGRVYGYDLGFLYPASGTSDDLASTGFLDGAHPLGYAQGRLPGFSIPADVGRFHIVHGSCRKPHGGGRDALPILDKWLETENGDPHGRPHLLLLTGDQIYADDVALCMARSIVSSLPDLIGWTEELAAADNSDIYTPDHAAMRPEGGRGETVAREALVSSGHAEAHLLFLGEYYAMYLMAWSDALWPRDAEGNPSLPRAGDVVEHPWLDVLLGRPEEAQRTQALELASTIHRVRRALANVPTLTIFDDHDVTDDWNLHRDWVLSVRGTRMGRRLVRNALLAYAVFQDWGNRPEAYSAGTTGQTLLEAVRAAPPGAPPLGAVTYSAFGLSATGDPNLHAPDRMIWHYRVDLAPAPIRITVLDSRTWRQFPVWPSDAAPALLKEPQLSEQLPPASGPGDRLELVTAAAPVLGILAWEEYLQRMLVSVSGPEAFDNEPWVKHRESFEALLRHLAGFGSLVILSGDVHFSYSITLDWFGGPAGSEDRVGRIVQLCSSPLKNEGKAQLAMGRMGHEPSDDDGPMELGWQGWAQLPPGTRESLRDAYYEDLLNDPGYRPHRLFAFETWWRSALDEHCDPPAVLPVDLWPGHASMDVLATLPPSEWAYRVCYLRDGRPNLSSPREIVARSNIARATFSVDSAGRPIEVVHRIHHFAGSGDETTYTEHRASLTIPSTSTRPAIP